MTYQKERDEAANNCTELICLVPRKESITALSSLLSDHDTEIFCGCEIKQVFKAGSDFGKQWEEKRVEGLLAAVRWTLGKQASTIFIEEPEHVKHFFTQLTEALKAYEEAKK